MPIFSKKRPCPDRNRDGTIELGEDCFDEYLLQNSKVVLMFYSPTCRHSLAMEPLYAGLRSEMGAQIQFCKVSTTNAQLTKKYNVRGTPTFFFVREGAVISSVSGEARMEALKAEAVKLLAEGSR
ncbi:MAG TPA: thioredoxin family protein [Methanomassiliicoccales archaeon]|nr:thioredoxin family protein [Methanomassiliicoccales archaeon]